jgi:murein DD-endopeptidase MepM/ murein hydrolase activator NlpD
MAGDRYLFHPFNRGEPSTKEDRKRYVRWAVAGILVLVLGLCVIGSVLSPKSPVPSRSEPPMPAEPSVSAASSLDPKPLPVAPVAPPAQVQVPQPRPPELPIEQLSVVTGTIGKRGTLYDALLSKNISPTLITMVVTKLRPLVDFGRCQPGDRFTLWFRQDGTLAKATYVTSPLDVYVVDQEGDDYVAYKDEVPVERYLVRLSGEIDCSLFEAINRLNEQDYLAVQFSEIFAWEIDFYQDVRVGDRFAIVVEKIYKDGEFIKYGPVWAAAYQTRSDLYRGFRFEESPGEWGYFDEEGHSLQKAFLRAPLQFRRISSGYTRCRRHPILGGLRPHYGIDYAAPTGTPVWAVADGVVVEKARNKAYGLYVSIRHPQGYRTYYGHFSRFARGVKKGLHVKQKQVIGYVGATGYATGPHLDYRLKRYGKYRNPLKEKFPAGRPIASGHMERFTEHRDGLLTVLEDDTFVRQEWDGIEELRRGA